MGSHKRVLFTALAMGVWASLSLGAGQAAACTAADFGAVVDQTAQALRDLNVSGAQRFQAKLQSLSEKHGLTQDEIQTRAAALQDDKMSEFNREIDTLVNQMDALSQTPNDRITCEKLDELKRVRDRLLTIMGQKSGYMLAKADIELDKPAGAAPASPPKDEQRIGDNEPAARGDRLGVPDSATQAPPPLREDTAGGDYRTPPKGDRLDQKQPDAPAPEPRTAEAPTPSINPALPERRPAATPTARPAPQQERQTVAAAPPPAANTRPDGEESPYSFAPSPPAADAPPTALAPPPDGDTLPPPGQFNQPLDTTYSISEIQEAGRGVFGTITAQFAAAINYAFQNFGQPTGYISGSEGGAAMLAGLRYGSGTLHVKTAAPSPIYWQGPSAGFDFGAEGSNALFLVYNLEQRDQIYGRFTGIGGSAYVAGGVGLNVLGKSGMVMVPIRSGIGLRLGANLAYLKFTERQTWNPF